MTSDQSWSQFGEGEMASETSSVRYSEVRTDTS